VAGGTHGFLNTDPEMQAVFIAWGAGIPKGVSLGNISNLDVAPTITTLLGLKMESAKGHAIGLIVNGPPDHSHW
jgi:predicted AlkP superfamily pyrophosphatase or phosphodiesterase